MIEVSLHALNPQDDSEILHEDVSAIDSARPAPESRPCRSSPPGPAVEMLLSWNMESQSALLRVLRLPVEVPTTVMIPRKNALTVGRLFAVTSLPTA